ncbi:MAG TPA: hypothetical protein VNC21_08310, partial [Vicinamibacterales bacterium]|nr:hypothetical protein [Vicinamibacterales bacterium]
VGRSARAGDQPSTSAGRRKPPDLSTQLAPRNFNQNVNRSASCTLRGGPAAIWPKPAADR